MRSTAVDDLFQSLGAEQVEQLDRLLIAGGGLKPILALREWLPGIRLYETKELIESREAELRAAGLIAPPPPAPPLPDIDELRRRMEQIDAPIRAIEAMWDCDMEHFWLILMAIVEQPSHRHPRYAEVDLVVRGHPVRVRGPSGELTFEWDTAAKVSALGSELARRSNLPFFFSSPDSPDLDLPRWWDG